VNTPQYDTLTISVTDPCLCGSGRSLAECCYAEINTTPTGPQTGYGHPECYAHDLHDCSHKMSKEHFLSQAVIRLFDTRSITVGGAAWLNEGEEKTISRSGLLSKMLCDRHNAALSGLDSLAAKFFSVALGRASNQWAAIIRGSELERWMLKLCFGFFASGSAQFEGRPITFAPAKDLLETIFSRRAVLPRYGLYHVFEKEPLREYGHVAMDFTIGPSSQVLSFDLRIDYFRLSFLFTPIEDTPLDSQGKIRFTYHPRCIVIEQDGTHRELHFGWPDGSTVTVSVKSLPGPK
jgi:hypothetical protein